MFLKINGQHVNIIILLYTLLSTYYFSFAAKRHSTPICFIFFPHSIVILYLRFGAQVLQDNFVAELSTHYQNYILVL